MEKQIIISYKEFQELEAKANIGDTGMTAEEYLACTTALVMKALNSPELFKTAPKDGIILNINKDIYRATIQRDSEYGPMFKFVKI